MNRYRDVFIPGIGNVPHAVEANGTKKYTVLGSEFNPHLCCEHKWAHLLGSSGNRDYDEKCYKCGASCTRNTQGQIETYSRPGASGY